MCLAVAEVLRARFDRPSKKRFDAASCWNACKMGHVRQFLLSRNGKADFCAETWRGGVPYMFRAVSEV